jgi:hypothetical protein
MASIGGQADGMRRSALQGTGKRDGSRSSVLLENGGRSGSWNSASWNSASWNSLPTALNALGDVVEAGLSPARPLVDTAALAVLLIEL